MAGTVEKGKIPNFDYSDKELQALIDEYQAKTKSGEIELPSWPDFCFFIGCENATLEAVMDKGYTLRGAYYARAQMLRRMGTWCEAQLVSNPRWGGSMSTKAMRLLAQGFGGTHKYTSDRDTKNSAKAAPERLIVDMGSDKRAKEAGK